jgi:hypothetical protein
VIVVDEVAARSNRGRSRALDFLSSAGVAAIALYLEIVYPDLIGFVQFPASVGALRARHI